MSIKSSILARVRLTFLVVAFVSVVILGKVLQIQVADGEKWRKKAADEGLDYKEVQAARGNVLSDNGSMFAVSLPFYRLAIDPTIASDELFNKGVDSLGIAISDYFNYGDADSVVLALKEMRAKGVQYKRLCRRLIDEKDKEVIEKWPIIREGRLKGGLILEVVNKRFKPFGGLAHRTVGFVRQDSVGDLHGRGLEYSFNKILAGVNGKALYQRIPGGHWKPITDGSHVNPQDGFDIETTIDVDIQEFSTEVLKKALRKNSANYGCVALMEVNTGEIKALVNLGKNDEGQYVENQNYAVGEAGSAEPGSTFKLASMIALFENSNLSLEDTVNTLNGQYKFFEDAIMTDARYGGYGKISIRQVFEYSSNIGVSRLIYKHFSREPQKYIDALHKIGIATPLDFQMKGEAVPYIKSPKDDLWSGSTLPWMSIGYEIKLAPIQTLALYNAIANNGKMIQPIIVKRTLKANRTLSEYHAKVLVEKVCSDETLVKVQDLLQGVVKRGTARKIASDEYLIAGKTGTAEKVINKKHSKNRNYTSFVGYFPADKPQYSCIVIVDDPKGEHAHGGDVAAPVFREISDMVYDKRVTRKIEELEGEVEMVGLPFVQGGKYEDLKFITNFFGLKYEENITQEWAKISSAGDTILYHDNPVMEQVMPDTRGMSMRDAVYLLESYGLNVRLKGAGRVKSQSIPPGSKIRGGGTVYLSFKPV